MQDLIGSLLRVVPRIALEFVQDAVELPLRILFDLGKALVLKFPNSSLMFLSKLTKSALGVSCLFGLQDFPVELVLASQNLLVFLIELFAAVGMAIGP
jgi:hypothetical protein